MGHVRDDFTRKIMGCVIRKIKVGSGEVTTLSSISLLVKIAMVGWSYRSSHWPEPVPGATNWDQVCTWVKTWKYMHNELYLTAFLRRSQRLENILHRNFYAFKYFQKSFLKISLCAVNLI